MTDDRVAIIGGIEDHGLDWLGPSTGLQEDLVGLLGCLRRELADGFSIPQAELLEGPTGFTAASLMERLTAIAAAPPADALWLLLGGEVVTLWGTTPCLVTGDTQPHAPGLQLLTLCNILQGLPTRQIVVVLDVHRAEPGEGEPAAGLVRPPAATLAQLPWPSCTLLAAGAGVLGRIAQALTSPAGDRRAEDVLAALEVPFGRVHPGDAVLNTVTRWTRAVPIDANRALKIREYLTGLRDRTSHVAFDRPTSSVEVPELGRVYVPTYALAPDSEHKKEQRLGRAGTGEEPRETLHDLLPRHSKLFVIGDPGSGKTTFLRRVAHEACVGRLDSRPAPRGLHDESLPLLLSLEAYGKHCRAEEVDPSPDGLLEYGFSKMLRSGSAEALDPDISRDAARAGQLVLLLDGLDEVPGSARRKRMGRTLEELAKLCQQLVLVVTCRPAAVRAGAAPGHPFTHTTIEAFDQDQRQTFIEGWMGLHHGRAHDAKAATARLLADIETHPGLADEIPNPLMLTIICTLFHEQGQLPHERSELYKAIVQLRLVDRDKELWDGPATKELNRSDRQQAAQALAWSHWSGTTAGSLISASEAIRTLDEMFDDKKLAKDLLDFLDERAGLLRWQDDDSATDERRYGFPHRTLAEYLVAGRLAAQSFEDSPPGELAAHAGDSNWREVACLYSCLIVGDVDRPSAPVWRLISDLACHGANANRSWADRAAQARLAAECLAEVRDRAPTHVKEAVEGLQPLFTEKETAHEMPAGERIGFWTAVGSDDRRFVDVDPWVDVPAGRFWRGSTADDAFSDEKPEGWVETKMFKLGRWPVTVAEYGRFITQGKGYGDDSWWDADGWAWREEHSIHRPRTWDRQLRRGPHFPVVEVSWWEARAYCRWLEQDERNGLGEDWTVRLPTESEWEKAARGNERLDGDEPNERCQRRYPWGDTWDADLANSLETEPHGIAPVGCFPGGIGPHGTWDQAGNVWEWCSDWFDDYPEEPGPDPQGPESGRFRVIRGGGWAFDPRNLRASSRHYYEPGPRNDNLGFRVAAAPPEPLDP